MTTPNTDPDTLYAEVYQILVDHPVAPPTYAGDAPLGQKRHRTAQLLTEFVEAAVKRGQAEAWDEGAQAQADTYGGQIDTGPNPYREETPDEQ